MAETTLTPTPTQEEQKKPKKVVVKAQPVEEQIVEVSVQPHMEQYAEWPVPEIIDEVSQGLDFLATAHAKKSYKDFKQCILDLQDLVKICQANLDQDEVEE